MITVIYPQNKRNKIFFKKIKIKKKIKLIGNLKFAENPDENLGDKIK